MRRTDFKCFLLKGWSTLPSEMTAETEECALGSLVGMQKGYAFKSKWYSDSGREIVKVSNFTEDSVDASELVRIPESIAEEYSRYKLKRGDIIVQTVG